MQFVENDRIAYQQKDNEKKKEKNVIIEGGEKRDF